MNWIILQDDYEDERSTNLSAVMAALQMWDAQDIVSLLWPPGQCFFVVLASEPVGGRSRVTEFPCYIPDFGSEETHKL